MISKKKQIITLGDIYTAVIAVRAGSKRIKNKNIQSFGSSNLLIHKIRQLKRVSKIDKIVVTSDSNEMLKMAKNEGVEIQIRPVEYADEKTKTFGEMIEFVVSNIKTDYVVWTPCVCPLVDENIISLMIKKFKEEIVFSERYDSLVSAKLLKEYIWDKDKPLNYSIEKHVKSQDLPNWYTIINGCFISSKINMLHNKFCYGHKPYMYKINKIQSIDIDDEYDLEIARIIYDKLIIKKE